jgi:putative FmdB family regulatory protein
MPTYEYSCKSCAEHLEVVQSFKDDALTVCPSCGGELKKVFGNIGIVFKGSGFYKNDSRAGRSTSTLPASGGSANGSESKTAGSGGEAAKSSGTDGAGSATKSEPSSPAPAKAEASSTNGTSGAAAAS